MLKINVNILENIKNSWIFGDINFGELESKIQQGST